MRRFLLLPAASLGMLLSQAPVHAQGLTGVTQYPPAPNAASQAPQPLNSVPRGGATGAVVSPGASINATPAPAAPVVSATPPSVNTLHPLRQPRRTTRRRFFHRRTPVRAAPAAAASDQ